MSTLAVSRPVFLDQELFDLIRSRRNGSEAMTDVIRRRFGLKARGVRRGPKSKKDKKT